VGRSQVLQPFGSCPRTPTGVVLFSGLNPKLPLGEAEKGVERRAPPAGTSVLILNVGVRSLAVHGLVAPSAVSASLKSTLYHADSHAQRQAPCAAQAPMHSPRRALWRLLLIALLVWAPLAAKADDDELGTTPLTTRPLSFEPGLRQVLRPWMCACSRR
jgi:hypothetical protein